MRKSKTKPPDNSRMVYDSQLRKFYNLDEKAVTERRKQR